MGAVAHVCSSSSGATSAYAANGGERVMRMRVWRFSTVDDESVLGDGFLAGIRHYSPLEPNSLMGLEDILDRGVELHR